MRQNESRLSLNQKTKFESLRGCLSLPQGNLPEETQFMIAKDSTVMPTPRYDGTRKIEFDATKQFSSNIAEQMTEIQAPIGLLLDKWGMNFETPQEVLSPSALPLVVKR